MVPDVVLVLLVLMVVEKKQKRIAFTSLVGDSKPKSRCSSFFLQPLTVLMKTRNRVRVSGSPVCRAQ